MVLFAQSGCFCAKWLYLDRNCGILKKLIVFGQVGCFGVAFAVVNFLFLTSESAFVCLV